MNIEQIKIRLSNLKPENLKGLASHKKLAPEGRFLPEYASEPENSVKSAVMILLHPDKSGELSFPVIRRTADKTVHSRQISFPGGRYEPEDKVFSVTAIRETSEEIGIKSEDVEVLAQLSPLYIPVSNYTVYPFVGFLPYLPEYVPAVREVSEILEIKFTEIQNLRVETKTVQAGTRTIDAPFLIFENVQLWGATAMIIQEFSDIFAK